MASNTTLPTLSHLHPYYPIDCEIPDYASNSWSVPALLSVFFGACTALFSTTYFLAHTINPRLRNRDLLAIMWFVLSGCIHLFFEGYYAANWGSLGSQQTLVAQMWKEYAFSDSRYLTRNSFVLCMESMTAVCWGPGCLVVAWLVVKDHPLRYPIQLVVSVGQFYGDALYYATSIFDHYVMGVSYSRPEAFYFWFYFFLMNFFWILIPGGECLTIEDRKWLLLTLRQLLYIKALRRRQKLWRPLSESMDPRSPSEDDEIATIDERNDFFTPFDSSEDDQCT